jgi:methionyl-tRNA synthetase
MLLAAEVALPKRVWAHGYVQWEGAKMSKTAGTAVSLDSAIARHGPDALRYYLLRDIGFRNDGDFTWERFDARYTADLADGLGNLASRSLAMIARYRDGVTPSGQATSLDEIATGVLRRYAEALDEEFDFGSALQAVWDLVNGANQYIVRKEPWALAKAGKNEELDEVLAALARCLYRVTVLVEPFIPGKARELWSSLGQAGAIDAVAYASLAKPAVEGRHTSKPPILFPKPTA